MIKIKRVLYLLNDNTYVNCEHDSIVVKTKVNETEFSSQRLPVTLIEQIIIFGNVTVSSYFVKFCTKNGIQVSYVSVYGNYYGRFIGQTKGNILLRKKQYDLFDNEEKRIALTKNIVLGKMLNMISTLEYFKHDSRTVDAEAFNNAIHQMKNQFSHLGDAKNMDSIRGTEGIATECYFRVLDNAIKNVEKSMRFERRSRRPPENNFNACLSLLYTMLNLNCISALETFGLDSYLGYLHEMKPGRESLANDLIEEFRAPLVDRFVISVINKRQITSKDFEDKEQGIIMTDTGRKSILSLWEEEKEKEVKYPLTGKFVPWKIVPYLQAQLLSQHIRGDIEEYPPFFWEWK